MQRRYNYAYRSLIGALALLLATPLRAQNTPIPLAAGTPEQAYFPCDFTPFLFTNELSEEIEVPPNFCPNELIEPHRPQWIGFTPATANAEVQVTAYDCWQNEGIQVAVWREFAFFGEPQYMLVSDCYYEIPPFESITLSLEGMQVGATHYFVFDGFNDDRCIIEMSLEEGWLSGMPVTEAPEISFGGWPADSNCPDVPAGFQASEVPFATAYNWSVDGLPQGQGQGVELAFEEPGLREVCVTPSNDCYGDGPTVCDTVEVLPRPELFSIPDTQVCGSFVLPPILGENLTGNQAYSIGFPDGQQALLPGTVIDTSVVLVAYDGFADFCRDFEYFELDVSPAVDLDSIVDQTACSYIVFPETDSSLSIAYYTEPGGNGAVFLPGDTTFSSGVYYQYYEQDECVEEQAFTVELSPVYCADGVVNIDGRTTKPNGSPVSAVAVELTWLTPFTDSTNEEGYYAFDSLPAGQDYVVRPTREQEVLDGVDFSDAMAVLRHALGLQTFYGTPETPYLLIAADVNSDQAVTIADFMIVRNTFIGFLDTFPDAPSWRFVPADFTFTAPDNPWLDDFPQAAVLPNLQSDTTVDFYGIKIGDVDFTNTAEGLLAGPLTTLNMPDRTFEAGEKLSVPLTVEEAGRIGFQFGLRYDTDLLALEQVRAGAELLPNQLVRERTPGQLPVLLGAAGLEAGATVLELSFTAQKPGQLREALGWAASGLERVAMQKDGRSGRLAWAHSRPKGLYLNSTSGDAAAERLSAWCQPNPFADAAQLHFRVPLAGNVRIQAYTPAGQLLRTTQRFCEAGAHQLGLSDWLPQPGTYLITVSSEEEAVQLWVLRM